MTVEHSIILPGDPAPWFVQASLANPKFHFHSVAGRYVVLGLLGNAADEAAQRAIAAIRTRGDLFNDAHASFFGVILDPSDVEQGRVAESYPGYRFFMDRDGAVSRLYGALPQDNGGTGTLAYRRQWVVIDPAMRVRAVLPFTPDGRDVEVLIDFLGKQPRPGLHNGVEVTAPVLFLPGVFEPALCQRLVALYEEQGGEESGFMREENGRTVGVVDASHKRRKDVTIADPELIRATQQRIIRRVVPEIAKVHQFHVTRMERYIVACYAAEDGGHFRAHRDNTTKGTAHRRFAVSINLNDAFEGGEVSFPEFGPRSYKPPVGGAVVFSCSLLHAVSKVTAGQRFAFLPFLYDDAAAKIREENIAFLEDGKASYRA
jgi:predicted 2-oxoglutarate/Fe(II)-dependent dioxygenase YbiX/peroxiredoxin